MKHSMYGKPFEDLTEEDIKIYEPFGVEIINFVRKCRDKKIYELRREKINDILNRQ